MVSAYKTPGVYVQEIPKFPPSIAPVETAIPAFIGYTEFATRDGQSLLKKPVAIESIAEYQLLFGGGPSQDVNVYLDTNNNFVSADATSAYYLFDSLRMFYANGGGKCYIVSVGSYSDTPSVATLEEGLAAIADEDEPTLLVVSDAVAVGSDGAYQIQQTALKQCQDLMDRFTLCDLYKKTSYSAFDTEVNNFRTKIGINGLKYGAAYGPWINATLPRQILRRNLLLKRAGVGTAVAIESLTTDAGLLALIADIKDSETSVNGLKTKTTAIAGAGKSLTDVLQKALDDYRIADGSSQPALQTALRSFSSAIFKSIDAVSSVGTPSKVKKVIDDYIASTAGKNLKSSLLALAAHHAAIKVQSASISTIDAAMPEANTSAVLFGFADTAAYLAAGNALLATDLASVAAAYAATAAGNHKARGDLAQTAAYDALTQAITFFSSINQSLITLEKSQNDTLYAALGKFKELANKASDALNVLPPSGAIAGIYAAVDGERGVWKAPANVSVSAIVGPAVAISNQQQESYNVDVNAGKSINIIRTFPGKGTLVWGARTLAGNDNEWRYINVRRLFNFIEESVKKASMQFVFEPNDANTWVKLQAMIENFLNTLWRQGALQGVKPEHAFYVSVGLGKTMTQTDILEGRLIVEVGLAAVRPAEFIVLKFSHKMIES